MSEDFSFDEDQFEVGSGKMRLSPQAPLLVTGITILTSTPDETKVKGKVAKFPFCNDEIVTGFASEAYGRITLHASVNLVSAPTTATISLQLVTDAGNVLTTTSVNPGTATYTLDASTYTQPGTKYFVELVILNSDATTSVTVTGGKFKVEISSNQC